MRARRLANRFLGESALSALARRGTSAEHPFMPIASTVRVGLVAIVCAGSFGCGDGGGPADMAANTAGSAGVSAGTSSTMGGSSAGTAPSGGSATGGDATGGSAIGGSAATGGSATGGTPGTSGANNGGGGMIDPNGGAPAGPASGRHTPRPSGSVDGTTAGYWEYLPPQYGNGALYPLLVFRHGIGENGNGTTDLQKVVVHGPPKLIEADQWPEARPFIVLSVQHPGSDCPSSQEIADFLTFAIGKYDVDPKRVYLTGLSCGAIGSWNYLGDHLTEKVAAAVLIAGDARAAFGKAMCSLGSVPIWAFHGDADPTVLPAYDGVPIASLKMCTSPAPVDLKYTVYPGVQHDSWTMTYDLSNPANDIYAWLLSHQKM